MQPLAVLGLGCHLPGGESPAAFWATLRSGQSQIRPATAADLGATPADILGVDGDAAASTMAFAAPPPLVFDPSGLCVASGRFAGLGPDFTWPVHVARQALTDAGLARDAAQPRCGVILAHYAWAATSGTRAVVAPLYARAMASVAGRAAPGLAASGDSAALSGGVVEMLAASFGLGGPCYAIDAACASFQFALKLAALHLAAGDADRMLVVAANAGNAGFMTHVMAALQALDRGGASRPFDIGAAGLTLADGAVAVLVGCADAVAGQRVRGVITGIGLASDGRGENLTSPNPKGQLAACERAYAESGATPESVDFVECHATGTPVGDHAELALIRRVFAGRLPKLGGVKGQIGHVMTASGGAGLLKLLLALEHGEIPPTPGVTTSIAADVDIQQAVAAWPRRGSVRRGALNSFGFGGTNGHLIVEEAGGAIASTTPPAPQGKLAITGMATRIGGWADLDAFAAAAYQGASGLRPLPPQRWRGLEADSTLLRRLGFADAMPPEGAYLDTLEVDPLHLRLPPKDLDTMNPQQLLMLQVGDAALRDAGLTPGARVGVVIAMAMEHGIGRIDARLGLDGCLDGLPVEAARRALQEAPTASDLLACIGNVTASRIAAAWDFSGPALTLSAGEAGVAHALAVARRMLDAGEAEAVLVGAVDLAGGIENLAVRLLGRPAPEGWHPGEGAAAVVLRRVRADVPCYVTIDGLQVLRAGAGEDAAGVAARCAAAAMHEASVAPDMIGYLEAADSDALPGLATCYRGHAGLALGDVAGIAGDCGVVSGLLGLVHAALAVSHRFLPGGAVGGGHDPVFAVSAGRRPWLAAVDACFAGVHLAGGAEVAGHVVLAAASPTTTRTRARVIGVPLVVPVPGQDGADIAARLGEIAAALRSGTPAEDIERDAVARFAAQPELPYAACLVAADAVELEAEATRVAERVAAAIKQGRSWRTPAGSFVTGAPIGPDGKTAFVYSGVHGAYPGQCRDVLQLVPGLGADFLGRFPDPRAGLDADYLFPVGLAGQESGGDEAADARLAANPTMQVVIGVTASFLYTRLATDRLGVHPDMAFGYSLGEVSMLYAAGAWRFDETCLPQLTALNDPMARLFGPQALWPGGAEAPEWAQYAVAARSDEVAAAVAGVADVYMTLVNSPAESTLVGACGPCERILASLDADWIRLPARMAMHCPPARAETAALTACFDVPLGPIPGHRLMFGAGEVGADWHSAVLAARLAQGLVQEVNFPALIDAAWNDGARLFIEIGPGSACTRWIDATLAGKPHAALPMARRGMPEPVSVAQFLAVLVGHRRRIDLTTALDRPAARPASGRMRRVVVGGEAIAARFQRFLPTPETPQIVTPPMPPPAPIPVMAPPPMPMPMPMPHAGVLVAERPSAAHDVVAAIAAAQSTGHLAYLRQRTTLARVLGGAVTQPAPVAPSLVVTPLARPAGPPALFGEADVIELSDGRISNVFGPDYAAIDALPLRLRLASQPFTAISRVTALSGTRGVFSEGHITTEFDVTESGFFRVGEALASQVPMDGQGVLFLLAWLGIDFENQGLRRFRWLDAHFTYTGDMPRVGETLCYDINLRSTFSDGNTRVLTFDVEGTARDAAGNVRNVIRNEGCQVGFFTDAELARGIGIGTADFPDAARPATPFVPPLAPPPNGLDHEGVLALTRADYAGLSPRHALAGNPLLRLPNPSVLMLDRVVHFSAAGGVHGMGYAIAERCADPNHWATRTHFRDDEVVPGPCLMDGVLQLLRITALSFGMHLGLAGARFEPLPLRPAPIRFRRQLLPRGQTITFRADIVDIGMHPEPFIAADIAIMDGTQICGTVKGIGIRIAGGTRA